MQRGILALPIIGMFLFLSVLGFSTHASQGAIPPYQVNVLSGMELPVTEQLYEAPAGFFPSQFWAVPNEVKTDGLGLIVNTVTEYYYWYNYAQFNISTNNAYNPVFIMSFKPEFSGVFKGIINMWYGTDDEGYGIVESLCTFGNNHYLSVSINSRLVLNVSVGNIYSGDSYKIGFAYNDTNQGMTVVWGNNTGTYSYVLSPINNDGISLSIENQYYNILLSSVGGEQNISWYISSFIFPDV